MVKWRKPPEELIEYFHTLIPDGPGPVEFRPMFGSPCYWCRGNMFTTVHQESIVVRLSDADREVLLQEPDVELFEPMEGRPMREYVVLPPRIADDPEAAREWMARGLAYVATMPPKEKKKRKTRKRKPPA